MKLVVSRLGDFPPGEVRCIHLDGAGRLWVGVTRGGARRIDDPGAEHPSAIVYTTDDGLPSMSVAAVCVDPNDGSLWAGCLGATGGLAHVVGASIIRHQVVCVIGSHERNPGAL